MMELGGKTKVGKEKLETDREIATQHDVTIHKQLPCTASGDVVHIIFRYPSFQTKVKGEGQENSVRRITFCCLRLSAVDQGLDLDFYFVLFKSIQNKIMRFITKLIQIFCVVSEALGL